MAVSEALYKAITDYFEARPELASSTPFSKFLSASDGALTCFFQNRDLTGEEPRKFEITLENMIGYQDTRQKNLESLERYAKECAHKLYGFDEDDTKIDGVYIMTHGTTRPVRVDLSITRDGGEIKKTMYAKAFDPARLLGIELYCLVSGVEDYHLFFNRGIIVEDSQEGKHEFDLEEGIKDNAAYQRARIKLDVLSFYMGLDDVGKIDNYLVASDGSIKVIDFDVMCGTYSEGTIAAIKEQTVNELGISMQEYERIYKDEERLLKDRVLQKKDRIYEVVKILEESRDIELSGIGSYIRRSTENMLSEH